MGTISSARAVYGLSAAGTPVGTNVDGAVTVGVGQTSVSFTDADICYSFKVTATGAGDVATWTMSTGAVAQTTGTPTITDGDGNDFEGVGLASMSTFYAILYTTETISGNVTIVGTSALGSPDIRLHANAQSLTAVEGVISPGTIAFTAASVADAVTVTVIGKSS